MYPRWETKREDIPNIRILISARLWAIFEDYKRQDMDPNERLRYNAHVPGSLEESKAGDRPTSTNNGDGPNFNSMY